MADYGTEGNALLAQAQKQGEVVRDLKSSKAPEDQVKAAVAELLNLKNKFKEVTGKDYPAPAKQEKKKKAAPAAATPAGPVDPEKEARKAAKKAAKDAKKAAKGDKAARIAARNEAAVKKQAADLADDQSQDLYGNLALIQSTERSDTVYTQIQNLVPALANNEVTLRARVHSKRVTGRLAFVTLRQRTHTVQVVFEENATISKAMIKFIEKLNPESIVNIVGTVTEPATPVESCTQRDVEIKGKACFVVTSALPSLPLQIEDAARGENDPMAVGQDVRLDNRILDLRAEPNQAIFKLQSGVGALFRNFLLGEGFTEIHSPKIIGAASESGSTVFKLEYFGSPAFLAQSPQLYKQMAIAADFERVFEIGPVFRAEDSNTHRHLTEFTGMDFEMAFYEHYHEVLDVVDRLFVSIFKGLTEKFGHEIAMVNKQFNREPFKWLEPTLRLEWPEGIAMLREAGEVIGDFDDISTPQEKLLGRLVKEKYDTDFYILDKFPLNIRPFYTMPDAKNPAYSNSYDLMMRGEEIMSGAQRIHDPALLEERATAHGLSLDEIKAYIDAFRYGCPPHAGGGVGMERVVMLFLGLPNIRKTSLFPRDPKRMEP
ncbi:uncharacterized protein MONBRDRAFT_38870 [Monosiga brevicollis MX1]|uniref:aspartate--tRNA ligase n=1 Tax=Monosiga brevicollis TaxID=81824 RepID=A9VAN8_MONBE|nr:uncharacterized protein MONBRDRAFT_38870 [Monosiga brevicollis MX1]EDQ85355.1 predicted protein [Monosiga brevicollis MX1]|eukprot:XP_001749766.1 hypothetical protein [Monosiga brevicollis MX1]